MAYAAILSEKRELTNVADFEFIISAVTKEKNVKMPSTADPIATNFPKNKIDSSKYQRKLT